MVFPDPLLAAWQCLSIHLSKRPLPHVQPQKQDQPSKFKAHSDPFWPHICFLLVLSRGIVQYTKKATTVVCTCHMSKAECQLNLFKALMLVFAPACHLRGNGQLNIYIYIL